MTLVLPADDRIPPLVQFMLGLDEADRHAVDRAVVDRVLSPPGTNLDVDPSPASSAARPRYQSACGRAFAALDPAEVAFTALRVIDPTGLCPWCIWIVATRTGRAEEEVDHLNAAVAAAPSPLRVVVDLAATVLATADPDDLDGGVHPAAIALLAAISQHTPVPVHDVDLGAATPGASAPGPRWVCQTCSLTPVDTRAGRRISPSDTAGLVTSPCSVLGALTRRCAALRAEDAAARRLAT